MVIGKYFIAFCVHWDREADQSYHCRNRIPLAIQSTSFVIIIICHQKNDIQEKKVLLFTDDEAFISQSETKRQE
jgi:hypothetical protein